MSSSRHAPHFAARVLITRLLLCVLLVGQLVPARLIPYAWSDEARWAAMGLCTSHGELDGKNSPRTHPDDCCSLPCCHPAPAPVGLALASLPLRLERLPTVLPTQFPPPQAFTLYRTPPPRAPPFFGLV